MCSLPHQSTNTCASRRLSKTPRFSGTAVICTAELGLPWWPIPVIISIVIVTAKGRHDMEKLTKSDPQSALSPDRNPGAVYLASLTETGRRGVVSRLRQVAGLLGYDDPSEVPWHQLRYQHVAAIRSKLQERGEAPASVNLALCALRRIAREAFNLGLLDSEEYTRIRNVESVRGERLLQGRALRPGEIGALLDACVSDDTAAGSRDAALVSVLYAGGLRRAEVVDIDLADYDAQAGELRVIGKGNKQRLVPFDNGALDALADWSRVRGETPGPLFLPIDKAGRVGAGRLSPQAVYKILQKRANQAKVKAFSPHDLRRSFISDLLEAGADIATVQALAGHASPLTTVRYDRRGEEAKRRAVKLLHVPYSRRRNEP